MARGLAPTMAHSRGPQEVRRMWGTDETLRRIAAYVERLRRR